MQCPIREMLARTNRMLPRTRALSTRLRSRSRTAGCLLLMVSWTFFIPSVRACVCHVGLLYFENTEHLGTTGWGHSRGCCLVSFATPTPCESVTITNESSIHDLNAKIPCNQRPRNPSSCRLFIGHVFRSRHLIYHQHSTYTYTPQIQNLTRCLHF